MLGTVNSPNPKVLTKIMDSNVSGNKENLQNIQKNGVPKDKEISSQNSTVKSKIEPNAQKKVSQETPQNSFRSHLEEKIKKLEKPLSEETEGQAEINDKLTDESTCVPLESSECLGKSVQGATESINDSLEKVDSLGLEVENIESSPKATENNHVVLSVQTPKMENGQEQVSVADDDQSLIRKRGHDGHLKPIQTMRDETDAAQMNETQNKVIGQSKSTEVAVNLEKSPVDSPDIPVDSSNTKDTVQTEVLPSKESPLQSEQSNLNNNNGLGSQSVERGLAAKIEQKDRINLSDSAAETLHPVKIDSNKEDNLPDLDKTDTGEESELFQIKSKVSDHNQAPKGFEIANVESLEHAAEPSERASISAVEAPSRSGIRHEPSLQEVRPIDQILKHVGEINVSEAPKRISLTLSPGYLGVVRVTFQHEGDELVGVLQVQKPDVRKEIEETLPQLISSMQNNSIQVRRIEITQWDPGQQSERHDFSDGLDSSMEQDLSGHSSHGSSDRSTPESRSLNRANSEILTEEGDHKRFRSGWSDNIDKGLNVLV